MGEMALNHLPPAPAIGLSPRTIADAREPPGAPTRRLSPETGDTASRTRPYPSFERIGGPSRPFIKSIGLSDRAPSPTGDPSSKKFHNGLQALHSRVAFVHSWEMGRVFLRQFPVLPFSILTAMLIIGGCTSFPRTPYTGVRKDLSGLVDLGQGSNCPSFG